MPSLLFATSCNFAVKISRNCMTASLKYTHVYIHVYIYTVQLMLNSTLHACGYTCVPAHLMCVKFKIQHVHTHLCKFWYDDVFAIKNSNEEHVCMH